MERVFVRFDGSRFGAVDGSIGPVLWFFFAAGVAFRTLLRFAARATSHCASDLSRGVCRLPQIVPAFGGTEGTGSVQTFFQDARVVEFCVDSDVRNLHPRPTGDYPA